MQRGYEADGQMVTLLSCPVTVHSLANQEILIIFFAVKKCMCTCFIFNTTTFD